MAHETREEKIFLKRTFWVRVIAHMKKDTAAAFQAVFIGINIILVVLLGATLFILEFPLVKEFIVYVIVLPLSLFIVVKYLTVLPIIFFFLFLFIKPMYSAILLSLSALLSLIWILLV